MKDFLVIDFETANEKRNSACALGVAIVVDGIIVESKSSLIRPHEMRFAGWNTRIHGITEEDVINAPTIADIWPNFLNLIKGKLVIAHNASFDISVLRHSLHAAKIPFPRFKYLCSHKLSQKAWPSLVSHNLSFLASYHNIELTHHDPESDARAAAELVIQAGKDNSIACPLDLADHLNVTIGELYPDGSWLPSSSLRHRGRKDEFNFILPDNLEISSHPLNDKVVAFTGKVDFCTRDEAFNIVELLGGRPKTTVTKNTDYLIAGVQDLRFLAEGQTESSKLKKAKELRKNGKDIQIISSKDFYEMLFPEL